MDPKAARAGAGPTTGAQRRPLEASLGWSLMFATMTRTRDKQTSAASATGREVVTDDPHANVESIQLWTQTLQRSNYTCKIAVFLRTSQHAISLSRTLQFISTTVATAASPAMVFPSRGTEVFRSPAA